MYAAYGLVSQRPFAVLDRHLLGTAKGLQTKGCSVGGKRAPSHSYDRRRKEKSRQTYSGRARRSEKTLRLPLRHVPRKQWRRQGRPRRTDEARIERLAQHHQHLQIHRWRALLHHHQRPEKNGRRRGRSHQGRSPLESRESRQVVRQEIQRAGQALKLSARLPVCTSVRLPLPLATPHRSRSAKLGRGRWLPFDHSQYEDLMPRDKSVERSRRGSARGAANFSLEIRHWDRPKTALKGQTDHYPTGLVLDSAQLRQGKE